MIKVIIFDMDGLLIDSEPDWNETRRIMAEKAQVKWNKDDHEAVMGVSTHEWVSYMIDRLSLDMSREKVEETIVMTMRELYSQRIPFLPGAEQAVALSSLHYPTGLASGSPQSLINIVINAPAVRGKFLVVLSGDQFSKGKPSPDIYFSAAKALNIPPENCACFEDSGNGI
jgi:HAD superfamily hydrolase (TIGR01509 family)